MSTLPAADDIDGEAKTRLPMRFVVVAGRLPLPGEDVVEDGLGWLRPHPVVKCRLECEGAVLRQLLGVVDAVEAQPRSYLCVAVVPGTYTALEGELHM